MTKRTTKPRKRTTTSKRRKAAPATRTSRKRKDAETTAMIFLEGDLHPINYSHVKFIASNMSNTELYNYVVSKGYYWNTLKKVWVNIKYELGTYQAVAEFAPSQANIERIKSKQERYIAIMIEGGILRPTKKGYKRNKKHTLAKKYCDAINTL